MLQANQIEADVLLAELTATVQREQTASSEKVALQQLAQNDDQFAATLAQNDRLSEMEATLKREGFSLQWAVAELASDDAGRAEVARAVLQANQIDADVVLQEMRGEVQREQTASTERLGWAQLAQNDEQFAATLAQNQTLADAENTLKAAGLTLQWAVAELASGDATKERIARAVLQANDIEADLVIAELNNETAKLGITTGAETAAATDETARYTVDAATDTSTADRETRVAMLHTTLEADEKARAEEIAAKLNLLDLTQIFQGKENALALAVEEGRITSEEAIAYARITEGGRQADQADATQRVYYHRGRTPSRSDTRTWPGSVRPARRSVLGNAERG